MSGNLKWSNVRLTSDADRGDPLHWFPHMTGKKSSSHRLAPEERAKVFKALSDPSRVGIVDILSKQGPLNGTELAEQLGISLALLCHHWDVLAEAGIVQKDKVGQARYCSLDLSVIERATADWEEKKPAASPRKKRKASDR
jgi:DNA-binding transcriptional ArsR family regulator